MREKKYWNGESDRERMVDEVLSSRRRALWLALTVFLQAVCLVVFAVVIIWGLAALVK